MFEEFTQTIVSIQTWWNSFSTIDKVMFFTLILLFIILIDKTKKYTVSYLNLNPTTFSTTSTYYEGFENKQKQPTSNSNSKVDSSSQTKDRHFKKPSIENYQIISKTKPSEIYDDFYCDVYDTLVHNPLKNQYELDTIINSTHLNPNNSSILDIGSGTGHHVAMLRQKGFELVKGIDISPSMVKKAKSNYPSYASSFQIGDALQSLLFQPHSFSHIFSLYFTTYYIQNKQLFFQNIYQWLKPNGYFILHLVNRHRFDTLLPVGDVFTHVSPQKYTNERITTTKAQFDNYEYNATFDFDTNSSSSIVLFREKFKNKKEPILRSHQHTLFMEPQRDILLKAKNAGFILASKYHMNKCKYDYQYLYVLQKPSSSL
jgi:SAM-dependent methyltransferase